MMNWKLNERTMYLFEETQEMPRYLIVETVCVSKCVSKWHKSVSKWHTFNPPQNGVKTSTFDLIARNETRESGIL